MTASLLTDALAETIAAVRTTLNQPDATTQATFAAETALVDGYHVAATVRQFEFASDEPPSIGGTDAGAAPVELVLAGLAACQEIVYATYARVLGVPIDAVTVRAEGRLDLRGFYGVGEVPAGFDQVTYTVDIDSPASAAEVSRLIAAVDAHCPVLDILRAPIPVTGAHRHNGVDVVAN